MHIFTLLVTVGNVHNSRISTMDVVGVGETIETIIPVSKVGRLYKPNKRLILQKQ
ncbi:hypothetical protein KKD03_03420 [Patescibacteria group bacterium]|nr:hypothetical protein [Patescibacteria group bacterium]